MAERTPTARVPQERAVRTREAVLTAAAEVFEKYGYSAATVEQISAQAKTTKGALYFHFPSKAALAVAVVAQQHEAWGRLAAASDSWGLNGLDTLERVIREVGRTYAINPLMRAGVRLGSEQDQIEVTIDTPFVGWIQRVADLLRRGQQDGSVRRDLQCAGAARAIVASFYGVEEVSSRLTGRRDLGRRVGEWWRLTRPGLEATDSAS